jgi:hypothetical protein
VRHNANTALPRNLRAGTAVPVQPRGRLSVGPGFVQQGDPYMSSNQNQNPGQQNQNPGQQNQNPGQKPGQQQGGGQKPGQQQQDPSRRQGEKPMQKPDQDR